MDGQIEGVYSISMINCDATLPAPSLSFFLPLYSCTTPPYRSVFADDVNTTGLVTEEDLAVNSELRNSQLVGCSGTVNPFQHVKAGDQMEVQFCYCSMSTVVTCVTTLKSLFVNL